MTLIWPFKVTRGQTDNTIWFAAYNFLYVFYSNYSAIWHRNPVFSKWPWSDLSRSPKVKLITPFDSQHIISYTSPIVTIALSRTETLFSADDLDLTFQGHQRSNWLFHPICELSLPIGLLLTWTLYLVPFSSYSTSKISGHDLWPLWDIVGKNKYYVSTDNMQLCINHLLTRTLYLVSFPRYLRSKF